MAKSKRKIRIPKRKLLKLKWGVAGCGSYLENTFLPTFQQLKRSKLVSVYSSQSKRARFIAEKFHAESSYNNFDSFLNSGIDAVYISSKNSDHYNQVIRAANAGKNILCEKPMALNSKEAEEMIEACRVNNVFLTLNYVYRFHPLIKKTKELLDDRRLGKIISISTNFNIQYSPNNNYRFKKKYSGGGVLRDLGTHMIDILRFLGGEIIDINGVMDNVVYKSEVEDFASATVKFKKGGYGYLNVSYNSSKPFNRIEILGHQGSISIDNMIGKKQAASKLTINFEDETKKAFRKRGNKLLYLLRSVQKSFQKNEPPLITGEDGLINLRLMEELEEKCR